MRIACRRASLRPADRPHPVPRPTGRRGYPQPRRGNRRRRGWTLRRGHPPPPPEGARSPPSSRANDNLRADPPRDFHANQLPDRFPHSSDHPLTVPLDPPPPFLPPHPLGVRGCPPGTRPRPRGGHRLLPLPAQTLARPRSRLVGEIRTRAREARRGGRRDVRSIPTSRPRADQRAQERTQARVRVRPPLASRPVASPRRSSSSSSSA